MKKLTALFLSLMLILSLTACGTSGNQNSTEPSSTPESSTAPESSSEPENVSEPSEAPEETTSEPEETPSEETSGGKTLVVYYSASGNTEAVAGYIADATGGDLFKLVPVESYTSDDLDWTDRDSRVTREHDDESLRVVELENATPDSWDEYDTVFIGYPIWWGIAAWPVDGFISANDFSGKTVIPFCTSSSSGLGESGELLKEAAGTGDWLEGQRFQSRASEETVREWVESLNLQ